MEQIYRNATASSIRSKCDDVRNIICCSELDCMNEEEKLQEIISTTLELEEKCEDKVIDQVHTEGGSKIDHSEQTKDPTTKVTKRSKSSISKTSSTEDNDTETVPIYVVSGLNRQRILQLMYDNLEKIPKKAKRFRKSHTIVVTGEDLTVHHVQINSQTNSTATCALCDKTINKGEQRCNLGATQSKRVILNHKNYPNLCNAHNYHVDCYVVLLSTAKEGYYPVCYGTCTDRSGCRTDKYKSSVIEIPSKKERKNKKKQKQYENPEDEDNNSVENDSAS